MAKSETSFKPGRSGNPKGKMPGSRNKTTRALEQMLDDDGETILRAAIDAAKGGDMVAVRLCLDRLVPPRRDRPIEFALPPINSVEDLPKATAALIEGVATGEITSSEAAELSKLIQGHVEALKATDFDERLRMLEAEKR